MGLNDFTVENERHLPQGVMHVLDVLFDLIMVWVLE